MKYPALIAVVGFILGIIVGDNFDVPSFLLLGILLLTLAGSVYLYFKKSRRLDYLLLFCLFLAGFWRYELKTRDFPLNHISNFLDLSKPVWVTGQITADPDVREDKTYLKVATSKMEWDNKSLYVSGNILVKIKEATFAFSYGDVIQVQGYLNAPLSRRNPGLFDYQRYLSTKGIYGLVTLNGAQKIEIIENQTGNFFISQIIIPTKTFIKKIFEQTLDQPHQALLAGFVLGERRQIPEEIYEMFTKTGTLHLLAVSGFNVGVIVLFLLAIVKLLRIPKWINLIILLSGILIFSFITNNQPSVVRASIMAALFLLAFYLEREPNFVNVISCAALIILFYSPLTFFDVSFQLSFAATFGIGYVVPKMDNIITKIDWLKGSSLKNWIILPTFGSLAATLFTLPLNAYYFNQFSLMVVFSNMFLIPLSALAVVLGCLSAILGVISLGLAQIVSACNWVLLNLVLKGVEFFSSFPWAQIKVPSPAILSVMLFYFLLLLIILSIESKKYLKILAVSVLSIGVFWFGKNILASSPQPLKITCLDVGKGEAIFIQLPDKQNILLGTGYSSERFSSVEFVIAPFLYKKGIRQIEHLIIPRPQTEFRAGLNYLKENFTIKNIWHHPQIQDSTLKIFLKRMLAIPLKPGNLSEFGEVKVWIGLPDNYREQKLSRYSNKLSLVLEYKNFIWIWGHKTGTVDSSLTQDKKIVSIININDVEEVNFNWSNLKQDQPVLVISSYDRWKGRLENQIVKSQEKKLGKIWWTKENGAVTIESDGENLKIKPIISED